MDYTLAINHRSEPCAQNKLTIDYGRGMIKGTFSIYTFEDNGFIVHYIPSLNLSAYGDTEQEASEMLKDAILPDFCQKLFAASRPKSFEHLSKLGWSAVSRESDKFENTAYVDRNGVLRNFDLPEDTPIEEQLLTV
ncbi:type II toxin-antitoxin system HicB family antitoxin [Spirosoma jeollabukense]